MYDFKLWLFWYKFIFLAELTCGYALFFRRMVGRDGSVWRISLTVVVTILVAFAVPVIQKNSLYLSVMVIGLFAITLFGMKFCFDESWNTILFVGMFAYTIQHISYQIYTIMCNLLNVGGNIYTSTTDLTIEPLSILIFIVVHILVYVIAWALLTYRLRDGENLMISRKRLILLSIFMLFSDVVVNAFVVYNVENSASIVLNVFSIYNIMTCVFALSVQFLMLSNEHYESELKIVESLWRKDKQTYEMTKESMEIINTKCHDLRKRIRIARKRSRIDEQELAEIEHAINIYEDNIKTGNETLDVILSEASFICRNNHITFIAIADGARLDFMSSGDIYSVIQNAINNATNAVMSVKESDRRIIRVMVRENVGKTEIHVENYFNNVSGLQFEDGLPVTKKDKRYHGFGMRSIKNICKKYNGTMNVEIEDDIFNLNIVFPL